MGDWGWVWVQHEKERSTQVAASFRQHPSWEWHVLIIRFFCSPFFLLLSSFTTVISKHEEHTTKSSDSREKKSHKRRKKNTICQLNTYKQICVSFPFPLLFCTFCRDSSSQFQHQAIHLRWGFAIKSTSTVHIFFLLPFFSFFLPELINCFLYYNFFYSSTVFVWVNLSNNVWMFTCVHFFA